MRPLLFVLLSCIGLLAQAPERATRREIDNVAAFARLYGVVRYFFPSDAAAAADWNRLAVEGVQQVRAAADAKTLESALEKLFLPLGPGIEIAPALTSRPGASASAGALVAWRYFGAGFD